MIRPLLLLLLLAPTAWGANRACPTGTLTPTPITTGATPDTVTARAATAIVFQAVNTAGSATVEIQICCVGTCAATGANWAQVENSPMTLAVGTAAKGIANPTCMYRAATSACTGCSVTVGYSCAGP